MMNTKKTVRLLRAFSLLLVLVVPACQLPSSSSPAARLSSPSGSPDSKQTSHPSHPAHPVHPVHPPHPPHPGPGPEPDPLIPFGKAYGGVGGERATFVGMPSRTGGMFLTGTTYFDLGAGQGDFVVAALTKDGTVEWAKTFGEAQDDFMGSAAATQDGGVILAGGLGTAGTLGSNPFVVRLNADGSTAWQQILDVGGQGVATAVCPTGDGGFVVGCIVRSFSGTAEPWIVKLNSAGAPLWQNRYSLGELWTLQGTPDGGFIASVNPGGDKIWLFKVNAAGNPVWGKYLSENAYSYGQTILTTSDGGSLLVGKSAPAGATYDALALKLNADGTIAWEVRLGSSNWDEANCAVETDSGDFLVCGSSFDGTQWSAMLFRLHPDGTLAEQNLYTGAGYNFFNSIRKSDLGGYLIQGETTSFGTGTAITTTDLWVIQTDLNGVLPIPATAGTFTFGPGAAVESDQLPLVTPTAVVPTATSLGAPATLTVSPAP